MAWGRRGAVAAGAMGLVAVLLVRLADRVGGPIEAPVRYGLGMLVRFLGVVLLGVLVSADRERFPPLAAATGYLGTMLPLLYMETRRTR